MTAFQNTVSYLAAPSVTVASFVSALPSLLIYGMYAAAIVWYVYQIYDMYQRRKGPKP